MRSNLTGCLAFLAVSFAAGCLMVSSESIWIDEGQTLSFARLPTFGTWWHALWNNLKSEAQMPLGMFVAWAGEKILGTDEWSLRAVNLLWVSLAGLALGLTGRLLRQPLLLLLFLLNPFLWFYANEARPYALQICAGAWLLYVLVRVQVHGRVSEGDIWLFGFWGLVGFGGSLLFGFVFAGVLAALVLLGRRGRLRIKWSAGHWLALGVAAACIGALGLYYLYTLKKGASGAKLWKVSPLNVFFAAYEMLGFAGLGPPRNEMRELARTPRELLRHLLQPAMLVGLGTLGVLYAVMATRLWTLRRDPVVQWLLAVIAVTAACLFVAASVVKFPFWGRHLAMLLPFIITLISLAAAGSRERSGLWRRHGLTLGLAVLLAWSSLQIRFSPAYRKDDYRGAAHLALRALAAGKVVWWSADHEECSVYYGLTPDKATVPGARLVLANSPRREVFDSLPPADIVFLSKPDIHDNQGLITSHLARMNYRQARRLTAFVIWTRPEAGLETLVNAP